MRGRLLILCILISGLWASQAISVQRYVAADGNCGGAHAGASTTIQAGVNAMTAAGDITNICNGTYNEAVTLPAGGTSGSRKVLQNEPGHTPILTYSGGGDPFANLEINGRNFWTIRGFTMQGDSAMSTIRSIGIWNGASDNIIENMTFTGYGGTEAASSSSSRYNVGLNVSGGNNPASVFPLCSGGPARNIIRNNTFTNHRTANIFLTCTTDTLIEGNDISNTLCGVDSDGGVNAISVKHTEGGSGTIIRGNHIHDTGLKSSCGLSSLNMVWTGVWCDTGAINGLVENNHIHHIESGNGSATPASYGVFIEWLCNNWTIRNNVVHDIGYGGLRNSPSNSRTNQSVAGTEACYPGGYTAHRWYNNTVYNTANWGFQFWFGHGVVRNNIFANTANDPMRVESQAISGATCFNDTTASGDITIDHNLYWNPASGGTLVGDWGGSQNLNLANWSSASGDNNSISANPNLVNPGTGNYQLCTGAGVPAGCVGASPAINVGANLGPAGVDTTHQVTTDYAGVARPQGTAWDLGAYEVVQATVVVNFTASSPVALNGTSTLTYSATGATSCTPTIQSGAADTNWTGTSSANLINGTGSPKPGTARTSLTVYRMSCTDGTTTVNTDQTVSVIPSAPTGFTTSAPTPSSVTLAWTANSPTDLAGYQVLVCNATAVPGCTPNVVAGTFGLVTGSVARGLLGNTAYRFTLQAFNTSNDFSAASSVQTATTSVIPAGSPELLLRFEEGGGTTVFDESGHGHNSSAWSGTFGTPAHDGSFAGAFNGSQGARIARTSGSGSTGLEPTAVTIAAWVRRNGTQAVYGNIFRKTYQNNAALPFMSYKLGLNHNGEGSDRATCEIGVSGAQSVIHSAVSSIPDLGWVHLSCTYDPAAGTPQQNFYVNGATTLGGTATSTAAIFYDQTSTGDVYLSDSGAGSDRYTGLLDDVRIYPRALTPAEIAVLAGTGDVAPAAPTNLRVVSP